MTLISFSALQDGVTGVNAAATNTPLSTIYNDYNGNITDANISSSAAIAFSKIAGGNATALTAWTSWVPSLANLSGGTLNYAKYVQIGKTIHFRFKYTLAGAGVAGLISFTTPVTMNSDFAATDSIEGTTTFYDVSATTRYVGGAFTQTTSIIELRNLHTDGPRGNLEVTSASDPFTFATGDIIYCAGTIEAA